MTMTTKELSAKLGVSEEELQKTLRIFGYSEVPQSIEGKDPYQFFLQLKTMGSNEGMSLFEVAEMLKNVDVQAKEVQQNMVGFDPHTAVQELFERITEGKVTVQMAEENPNSFHGLLWSRLKTSSINGGVQIASITLQAMGYIADNLVLDGLGGGLPEQHSAGLQSIINGGLSKNFIGPAFPTGTKALTGKKSTKDS